MALMKKFTVWQTLAAVGQLIHALKSGRVRKLSHHAACISFHIFAFHAFESFCEKTSTYQLCIFLESSEKKFKLCFLEFYQLFSTFALDGTRSRLGTRHYRQHLSRGGKNHQWVYRAQNHSKVEKHFNSGKTEKTRKGHILFQLREGQKTGLKGNFNSFKVRSI